MMRSFQTQEWMKETFLKSFSAVSALSAHEQTDLDVLHKSTCIFHSFSGMVRLRGTSGEPRCPLSLFLKSHHGSQSLPFAFGEVSGPGGFSTGVGLLTKTQPSFSRFFCFILRFWNQIFTCVSLSSRLAATSTLRARVRYLLKWNSFSSSVSCLVVKLVRITLCWPGTPNSDTAAEERHE